MSYEVSLNRHRARSPILGSGDDADHFGGAKPDLSSAQAVQNLIQQYDRQGDAEREPGYIQAAQRAVQKVESEWYTHKRQHVARGQPEPKRMPPEIRERYDEAQARLAICEEERQRLGEILDGFIREARQDRRATILRQLGSGTVKTDFDPETGLLRTALDGQHIALADQNGVVLDRTFNPRDGDHVNQMREGAGPIVDDKASPYRGMSLSDYREHISEPLKAFRRGKQKEWSERNEQLPKDEQETQSHITSRARRTKPDVWPPRWPTGVVDWLDFGARQAQRDITDEEVEDQGEDEEEQATG